MCIAFVFHIPVEFQVPVNCVLQQNLQSARDVDMGSPPSSLNGLATALFNLWRYLGAAHACS